MSGRKHYGSSPDLLRADSSHNPSPIVPLLSLSEEFHRRIYWYSFALGFGLLLPFNFVINLIPWLSAQYNRPDFGFYASLALNNPVLAIQVVIVPCRRFLPSKHRIRGSLLAGAIALVLVAFAAIHAPLWAGLTLIAITGTAEAIMESAGFALLSQLPSASYTQAYMTGMAAAGVAAAGLQLVLHSAIGAYVPDQIEVGLYVLVGFLVLVLCIGIHTHLIQLPPLMALVGGGSAATVRRDRTSQHSDVSESEAAIEADTAALLASTPAVAANVAPSDVPVPLPRGLPREALPDSSGDVGHTDPENWLTALLRVGLAAIHPSASVFHCFLATFLVYPGVFALIPQRSTLLYMDEATWFSTLLLLYAVCDFVGRAFAGRHRPLPSRILHVYALCRYPLVVIVVGCARGWGGLDSDWVALSSVAVCGLTNGHVATMSMMQSGNPVAADGVKDSCCQKTALHEDAVGRDDPVVFDGNIFAEANSDNKVPRCTPTPLPHPSLAITNAPSSRDLADRDLTGVLLGACLKAGIVVGSDIAVLFT